MAIAVAFSACNPSSSTASGGASSDKVQLEIHLAPAQVFKQVTKTTQVSEQKMMGMATKISQEMQMYLRNEVESVDASGTSTIRCTYERVVVSMDNNMSGMQSYDSDKAEGSPAAPFQGYAALVHQRIGYRMDKHGTILEVMGVDSLMDNVMRSVGADVEGPEMEGLKNTLKSTFGNEAMKSMMQSASIQYPEALIGVGDTWNKKIASMGAIPMAVDATYKVDHMDAEKVVLSFKGTITTDKEKAMDLGVAAISMDLKGDYEGTSEISRKTGLVLKSTVQQDIDGSMGTMGMTIPMRIDQKITVEGY
ncbi:MAG: hypothetical protein RLZZ165_1686 [Bacteroidota bacterium]